MTGDLAADAIALMEANDKVISAAHSLEVAETCVRLAKQFGLDCELLRQGGLLHDIGGVIRPADMLAYGREQDWPLDPAEEQYPVLLHQRFSALLANELLGVSEAVLLEAVACHTTLRAHATKEQLALFLADKISWDRPGAPPYGQLLAAALERSLLHGARVYLDYAMEHDMIRMPHRDLLNARDWLASAE